MFLVLFYSIFLEGETGGDESNEDDEARGRDRGSGIRRGGDWGGRDLHSAGHEGVDFASEREAACGGEGVLERGAAEEIAAVKGLAGAAIAGHGVGDGVRVGPANYAPNRRLHHDV